MPEMRTEAPIISVVGAGGKTTLIYKIASLYEKEEKKAIITTTTHMERQDRWRNAYTNSTDEIQQLLKRHHIITAGTPCEENKIKILEKSVLNEILKWEVSILIEADGAKHMPCKVPRENEPVIIPETTIVLAVVGLDALYKPIKECCFCPEKAAKLLNCTTEKTLTCEDICHLMLSPYGMKKGVAEDMRYCIVLNKADISGHRGEGDLIKNRLEKLGQTDVYVI